MKSNQSDWSKSCSAASEAAGMKSRVRIIAIGSVSFSRVLRERMSMFSHELGNASLFNIDVPIAKTDVNSRVKLFLLSISRVISKNVSKSLLVEIRTIAINTTATSAKPQL